MAKVYRQGAAGALLDEYERAVSELADVISDIPDTALVFVFDEATGNPDCRSVQSILAHVIRSMYSYACYIRELKGRPFERPGKVLRTSAAAYIKDLEDAFRFNVETFSNIKDEELEEPEHSKKMLTSWEQVYDIEQLMEHAIVHTLRHRRQIEKAKPLLPR